MKPRPLRETQRLTPRDLDRIRASVDWRRLFEGLGLKKSERRSKPLDWWAFSPFHEERTPSFHMGPNALWHDFSIGEGGGPIELIQRLHECDCYEAGRILIENGWSDLAPDLSPARSQSEAIGRRISGVVGAKRSEEAEERPRNAPIRQNLIPLCIGHEALERRGVSEKTRALLGIGYLPQGRSPLRGRIVFQAADARPNASGVLERVILSHIGRAVSEDQEPKYLFYEGFHKSAELYGQDLLWLDAEASSQIRTTGRILLTEGPFDVARAVDAGLRNIVASFGASLSPAQGETLLRLSKAFGSGRILIAYDRDEAGRAGAQRAARLIAERGLEAEIFDWEAELGRDSRGPVCMPPLLKDLGDLSNAQLLWLRERGRL